MWTDQEHNRIRDRTKIREVLDAHMLRPKDQRAPWVATIFTREHRRGGNRFEGATIFSASTEGDEKAYQIVIGSESYQLKLSLIEYVVVL
jgi:hypothetical protein